MKKLFIHLLIPLILAVFFVSQTQADHPRYQRQHYQPGYRVDRLPSRHHRVHHKHHNYYYSSGYFFRPYNHHYEVVFAPVGARVPYLPPGYVSFYLGPRRYFYLNYTYYLWDHHQRDYVVVREPPGAADIVVAQAENNLGEIYAYPSEGQSAQQQERDYYDCHVWSVEATDYDPTLEGQNAYQFRDYRRAMIACLEGRGYSVR